MKYILKNILVLNLFLFLFAFNTVAQQKSKALFEAINSGNTEKVYELINSGINVNSRDIFENTPLHKAAAVGNIDMVSFLISQGADVNAKNKTGYTPAFAAINAGKTNILRILAENSANVNMRFLNDEGKTLLHLAVQKDQLENAQLLLEYNADTKAADFAGNKPLFYAKENGNKQMIELLKNKKWAKD